MKRGALLALCFVLVSCEAPSSPPPPAPPTKGSLDPDIVAVVAGMSVRKDQVARIAQAQGITPAEARDLAIHDALFAAEARARSLHTDRNVEQTEAALLARTLLREVAAQAVAQGDVTDAELDEVTERHWLELDRPESARTVHAVVTLKKDAPEAARVEAKKLAETIREAVLKASEIASTTQPQRDPRGPEDPAATEFRTLATLVPKGNREVRIEVLPPVVADGRVAASMGGKFDEGFARAALALESRGDVSPVVQTPFGFHVVFLLERIPSKTVPREERRRMVREEVMATRARADEAKLLDGLRANASIARDADAILALVPVER